MNRALLLSLVLLTAGCASVDDSATAPEPVAAPKPAVQRTVRPGITHEVIPYEQDGEVLEGHLYYNPSLTRRRPGVLVIHEWWGLGDHPRSTAMALARLGYVAFALDMYGAGRLTDDPEQAGRWAGRFRGSEEARDFARARARAGYDVLSSHPDVDPRRIAVLGYCFGGTMALELAWSGAPLVGAVSFHGHPVAPRTADIGGISASILVCHGAADGFVPDAMLTEFRDTMNAAGLDWMKVDYGNAVHSFTNPGADDRGMDGVGYDKQADRRSWEHLLLFLSEVFEDN